MLLPIFASSKCFANSESIKDASGHTLNMKPKQLHSVLHPEESQRKTFIVHSVAWVGREHSKISDNEFNP